MVGEGSGGLEGPGQCSAKRRAWEGQAFPERRIGGVKESQKSGPEGGRQIPKGRWLPGVGSGREARENRMGEWTGELWLWGLVLAGGVGCGVYVLEKLRRLAVSKRPSVQEWLSQFQKMHAEGVLSDQEFRTIKTALREKLQEEIHKESAGK